LKVSNIPINIIAGNLNPTIKENALITIKAPIAFNNDATWRMRKSMLIKLIPNFVRLYLNS